MNGRPESSTMMFGYWVSTWLRYGLSSGYALHQDLHETLHGNGGNRGRWQFRLTSKSVSTTRDIRIKAPTRSSRFASGWSVVNLVSFSPDIHAETIWIGWSVMPKKRAMFGCTKRFHRRISSGKHCWSNQWDKYETMKSTKYHRIKPPIR